MYYLAKLAQLAGLAVIALGFLGKFPALMNPRLLGVGILLFAFGWIVQKYLLKQ